MDPASPFAGIVVGQPTLARSLRMGVFAALDQRTATRFALGPMDLGESANYLRHHLGLAGPTPSLPMTPSPGCTGWPTACSGR